MKTALAIFALFTAISAGPAAADEPVDCFYEHNAYHPDCRK